MRMTDEKFNAVLNINLVAPFMLMRAAMMGMMKRRYGRIINMASIVGVMGNAGQANYSASKGGLIAMTKTVAQELASRGVTANCIAPGFVKTPMTDVLSDDAKDKLLKAIPMARLGEPQDIANAYLFLASDLASCVSGAILPVDGAMVI